MRTKSEFGMCRSAIVELKRLWVPRLVPGWWDFKRKVQKK